MNDSILVILKRYGRFMLGLFLCAMGVVINVKSNIGVAPWEVFSTGVSNTTGITIGQASIVVSVLIVALDYYLGVKIGLGTVLNMIFIGVFVDLIIWLDFIPTSELFIFKLGLLLIGMVIFNIGVFLYIGIGRGAGPRDGLMVGLCNKLNKPVQVVRTTIEIGVTVVGFLLGGSFGIGTIINAVLSGTLMGFMYKKMGFDIKGVNHKFLNDYFVKNVPVLEESMEVE